MKNPTNKICPLPWHHFYLQTAGRIKLCCTATKSWEPIRNTNGEPDTVTSHINNNRNHPEVVNARRQWLNGEVPQACENCLKMHAWKKVDGYTEQLITHGGCEPMESEIVDFPARYLDYRFDRTCQAYCIMCIPSDSSKWDSVIKNNPGFKKWMPERSTLMDDVQVEHQWLYDIDRVVFLTIAGGEPFISGRNYDFLFDNIHKIKKLRFISNINRIDDRVWQFLMENKHKIHITISCDGLYDTYEYVRGGLSWKAFDGNYQKLKEFFPMKQVSVNFIVGPYNEHQVEEAREYFKDVNNFAPEPVENAPWVEDREFLELWANVNRPDPRTS